jgi:cobalt-zinc-cadmium efflux system outer membrane protein
MMLRWITVFFLWQSLFVNAFAVESTGDAPITEQAAVEMTVHNNPGLAELQARASAAAAIPSQAGTLPDPMLSFNSLNLPTNSFNLSQEPMTQQQIGLSQAIPFPGKLALREETAQHEAEAVTNSVDELRLSLIRDVKSSWWQLFYLDRALDIVRLNQDLLRQFVKIAETKYKVGEGLQQDVLLAQVELSRLLDLEIQLTGARRNEAARFNALLNRPGNRPATVPREVDTRLPEIPEEEKLYRLAEEARPLLAQQRSRIDAARSRLDLAKKDYYPDFNLNAGYGFRSGNNTDGSPRADFATIGLAMNLPIYTERKLGKAVDQRNAELLGQTYNLQDITLQVQRMITAARADFEQARDQVSLFNTAIIPQSRQTVASMLAGYQVNKVDFLNLVRAQLTLYSYETQYWKALAAAHQALAKLAAAVGKQTIHE